METLNKSVGSPSIPASGAPLSCASSVDADARAPHGMRAAKDVSHRLRG